MRILVLDPDPYVQRFKHLFVRYKTLNHYRYLCINYK